MPVSSLDFSLVDAKDELHSDFGSESIAGDDLYNVEHDSKPELLTPTPRPVIANSPDNIASLPPFTEATPQDVSRASAWATLLGLDHQENNGSPQPLSNDYSTSKPHTNPEKRGILRCSTTDRQPEEPLLSINDLPPHKDEAQVMLDIKRSFTVMSHYNGFNSGGHSSYTTILSSEDIEAMRKRLYCLIVRVLRKYPALNYYQGYHDVASIVLLVCNENTQHGDETAFRILEALTLNHLRDFMIEDISLTINHLKLIPLIAETVDADLFELMKQTNNTYCATGGTYFDYKFLPGLSSILTLFSHDLTNINQLLLIWDFILGKGSVAVSAYVYVAVLAHFKPDIFTELGIDDDFSFENVDLDLAHSLLSPSSLLSDISDPVLSDILANTVHLLEFHSLDSECIPRNTFDVWFKQFNSDSVLMTTSKLSQSIKAKESPSRPEPPKLLNSKDLSLLIRKQESQQRKESAHEADLLQEAFDSIDSLSTSINSTFDDGDGSGLTLVSSFMSLNHTLINSSSNLLKKIVSLDSDGARGGNNPKREFSLSIYKLSLTIGFVGFLLHFLLKQSEFGTLLRGSPKSALQAFVKQACSFGEINTIKFVNKVSNVFNEFREYTPIRDMAEITQVGLGSVKRSIYTLGISS
ncbi:hypothetical protein JCM33374_g6252 [Metschnikowia sp. JCM 33374]|nr:hypothetical protein JCM33374_g6252 [Metschnikowia sp. JCM 33374]